MLVPDCGSEPVDRFTFAAELFETAGGETGDLFELGGEMGYTAIAELPGDLAEGPFVVDQPFFDLFDLLQDEELLDGDAFDLGEQARDVGVVFLQGFAKEPADAEVFFHFAFLYFLYEQVLDGLDLTLLLIVEQFETKGREALF